MRALRSILVAGAAVALLGTAGNGAGFNGTFDGLASQIAGAVAAGDPSAVKIDNWIRQPSETRSKDFGTLSKVFKEAAKDEYQVVLEGDLSLLFNNMVAETTVFGFSALQRVVQAANADPARTAKILKKHLLYLAKEGKLMQKYQDAAASQPPDYSKAARYYAAVAKLYESIDRAYPAAE